MWLEQLEAFNLLFAELIRIASHCYTAMDGHRRTSFTLLNQKIARPLQQLKLELMSGVLNAKGFALSKQLVGQRHHSCRQKILYMTWLGPRS